MAKGAGEYFFVTGWLAVFLAAFALVFGTFLPGPGPALGNDHAYFLPNLLIGRHWFETNGLWAVPWFSPAKCGGFPYYPDPQVGYYTIPQFLSFVVSPLSAVQTTFYLFAALGFLGAYLLLRKGFAASPWAALVAAAVFGFNGFYAHRMLEGHLTNYPYMLIPLLAWLALPRGGGERHLPAVALGGAMFAYAFQAGNVYGIPVMAAAVAAIALIHALRHGRSRAPWLRLAGMAAVALALSASRLVAGLALMANLSRDFYPLPGLAAADLSVAAFRGLFLPVNLWEVADRMRNTAWWSPGAHEFEYGVTAMPLLLGIVWWIVSARRRRRTGLPPPMLVALLALLALPLALNFYSPGWNTLLKEMPYFGNSSILVRWFALYPPVLAVVAGLAVDGLAGAAPAWRLGLLAVFGVALGNLLVDPSYHLIRPYDPSAIEAAAKRGTLPAIDRVAVDKGRPHDLQSDDSLVLGASQRTCYQPLFGYRLEAFPIGALRAGPALDATPAGLNLKNPACYVYPAANGCRPGDHFTAAERPAAEAFLRYRPISFAKPWWQTAADWLNLAALAGFPIMLVLAVLRRRASEQA